MFHFYYYFASGFIKYFRDLKTGISDYFGWIDDIYTHEKNAEVYPELSASRTEHVIIFITLTKHTAPPLHFSFPFSFIEYSDNIIYDFKTFDY